jgi:hypothetical protein
MHWLFLIAAIIVIFGFGTLMKIVGTMFMIGIGIFVAIVVGILLVNQR